MCNQNAFIKCRQFFVLFLLLMFFNGEAFAVKNYFEISESEMRSLPKFCWSGDRSGFKGLKDGDWMNHLCPGLNALNHAKLIIGNEKKKKGALNSAIGNFSYTLKHTGNNIYRPFVYLKRGEAYELAGNISAALADYSQALKLKPKSVSIHLALIDFYIKLGDVDKARDLVNNGLKIKPNSKSLLRRKKTID